MKKSLEPIVVDLYWEDRIYYKVDGWHYKLDSRNLKALNLSRGLLRVVSSGLDITTASPAVCDSA